MNGRQIDFSKPLPVDSSGHEMPRPQEIETTLKKGEFLVLSHQAENGFDSRYYGILNEENLVTYANPIWIK